MTIFKWVVASVLLIFEAVTFIFAMMDILCFLFCKINKKILGDYKMNQNIVNVFWAILIIEFIVVCCKGVRSSLTIANLVFLLGPFICTYIHLKFSKTEKEYKSLLEDEKSVEKHTNDIVKIVFSEFDEPTKSKYVERCEYQTYREYLAGDISGYSFIFTIIFYLIRIPIFCLVK